MDKPTWMNFPDPKDKMGFVESCLSEMRAKNEWDEVPWASGFINFSLKAAGIPVDGNFEAAQFLGWGDKCELKDGCIVVLGLENGKHHVVFCGATNGNDETFTSVGAASETDVGLIDYPKSRILGCRWPHPPGNEAEKKTEFGQTIYLTDGHIKEAFKIAQMTRSELAASEFAHQHELNFKGSDLESSYFEWTRDEDHKVFKIVYKGEK